jgi:hypothetical protein
MLLRAGRLSVVLHFGSRSDGGCCCGLGIIAIRGCHTLAEPWDGSLLDAAYKVSRLLLLGLLHCLPHSFIYTFLWGMLCLQGV